MALRLLLLIALLASAAPAGEVFFERVGSLEPFPRVVARDKELVLRGTLKGAYRSPELILIAPDGATYLNRDNRVANAAFRFTVHFEHGPGAYRMEILAHKPSSIRSLARFSVAYARSRLPRDKNLPPPAGDPAPQAISPRLVEKRLARILNRFRKKSGLKQAGWNEAVAARAREHAARMAATATMPHRFGGVGGVREMLARDGAGPGGFSGPTTPWTALTGERPFPRPALQPPGPRVRNHVTVFLGNDPSPEAWFERFFVREAAWRLCALDPNCVEIAVGAARPPPKKVRLNNRTLVQRSPDLYYCVCFVQVNDATIAQRQNRAYAALLKRAGRREPAVLRAVGRWGRPGEGRSLLKRALYDPRPEVSSAAFDGLLLLDEPRTRKALRRRADGAARKIRSKRYGAYAARWRPLTQVAYDTTISAHARRAATDADHAARAELGEILKQQEPARTRALQDLLARAKGLPVAAEIKLQLG